MAGIKAQLHHELSNGVIVGRTNSRGMWAWMCRNCGKGGLIPEGRWKAEVKGKKHVCGDAGEPGSNAGIEAEESDNVRGDSASQPVSGD